MKIKFFDSKRDEISKGGKRDSFIKKVGLLLVSILISLVIVEYAVKLFVFSYGAYELPMFETRPHGTSYRLLPNLHYINLVENTRVQIDTDAWGNVGKAAIPPERDSELKRIAVIGDSFAFGLWASDYSRSMVGIAAEQTAEQDVEWVNFSVPAYGYSDMRIRLEDDVFRWQPDLVLLCTFNGNDIRETFLGPEQTVIVNGLAKHNEELTRSRLPEGLRRPQRRRPLGFLTQPLRRHSHAANFMSRIFDELFLPKPEDKRTASAELQPLAASSNFSRSYSGV